MYDIDDDPDSSEQPTKFAAQSNVGGYQAQRSPHNYQPMNMYNGPDSMFEPDDELDKKLQATTKDLKEKYQALMQMSKLSSDGSDDDDYRSYEGNEFEQDQDNDDDEYEPEPQDRNLLPNDGEDDMPNRPIMNSSNYDPRMAREQHTPQSKSQNPINRSHLAHLGADSESERLKPVPPSNRNKFNNKTERPMNRQPNPPRKKPNYNLRELKKITHKSPSPMMHNSYEKPENKHNISADYALNNPKNNRGYSMQNPAYKRNVLSDLKEEPSLEQLNNSMIEQKNRKQSTPVYHTNPTPKPEQRNQNKDYLKAYKYYDKSKRVELPSIKSKTNKSVTPTRGRENKNDESINGKLDYGHEATTRKKKNSLGSNETTPPPVHYSRREKSAGEDEPAHIHLHRNKHPGVRYYQGDPPPKPLKRDQSSAHKKSTSKVKTLNSDTHFTDRVEHLLNNDIRTKNEQEVTAQNVVLRRYINEFKEDLKRLMNKADGTNDLSTRRGSPSKKVVLIKDEILFNEEVLNSCEQEIESLGKMLKKASNAEYMIELDEKIKKLQNKKKKIQIKCNELEYGTKKEQYVNVLGNNFLHPPTVEELDKAKMKRLYTKRETLDRMRRETRLLKRKNKRAAVLIIDMREHIANLTERIKKLKSICEYFGIIIDPKIKKELEDKAKKANEIRRAIKILEKSLLSKTKAPTGKAQTLRREIKELQETLKLLRSQVQDMNSAAQVLEEDVQIVHKGFEEQAEVQKEIAKRAAEKRRNKMSVTENETSMMGGFSDRGEELVSNNNYRGTRAEVEGNFDVTKQSDEDEDGNPKEEDEIEYFIEIEQAEKLIHDKKPELLIQNKVAENVSSMDIIFEYNSKQNIERGFKDFQMGDQFSFAEVDQFLMEERPELEAKARAEAEEANLQKYGKARNFNIAKRSPSAAQGQVRKTSNVSDPKSSSHLGATQQSLGDEEKNKVMVASTISQSNNANSQGTMQSTVRRPKQQVQQPKPKKSIMKVPIDDTDDNYEVEQANLRHNKGRPPIDQGEEEDEENYEEDDEEYQEDGGMEENGQVNEQDDESAQHEKDQEQIYGQRASKEQLHVNNNDQKHHIHSGTDDEFGNGSTRKNSKTNLHQMPYSSNQNSISTQPLDARGSLHAYAENDVKSINKIGGNINSPNSVPSKQEIKEKINEQFDDSMGDETRRTKAQDRESKEEIENEKPKFVPTKPKFSRNNKFSESNATKSIKSPQNIQENIMSTNLDSTTNFKSPDHNRDLRDSINKVASPKYSNEASNNNSQKQDLTLPFESSTNLNNDKPPLSKTQQQQTTTKLEADPQDTSNKLNIRSSPKRIRVSEDQGANQQGGSHNTSQEQENDIKKVPSKPQSDFEFNPFAVGGGGASTQNESKARALGGMTHDSTKSGLNFSNDADPFSIFDGPSSIGNQSSRPKIFEENAPSENLKGRAGRKKDMDDDFRSIFEKELNNEREMQSTIPKYNNQFGGGAASSNNNNFLGVDDRSTNRPTRESNLDDIFNKDLDQNQTIRDRNKRKSGAGSGQDNFDNFFNSGNAKSSVKNNNDDDDDDFILVRESNTTGPNKPTGSNPISMQPQKPKDGIPRRMKIGGGNKIDKAQNEKALAMKAEGGNDFFSGLDEF